MNGNAVYLYAALRALAAWKAATFTVNVDGERHTMTGLSVLVGNSKAYGGGMLMFPQAELDDGKLDVMLAGPSLPGTGVPQSGVAGPTGTTATAVYGCPLRALSSRSARSRPAASATTRTRRGRRPPVVRSRPTAPARTARTRPGTSAATAVAGSRPPPVTASSTASPPTSANQSPKGA